MSKNSQFYKYNEVKEKYNKSKLLNKNSYLGDSYVQKSNFINNYSNNKNYIENNDNYNQISRNPNFNRKKNYSSKIYKRGLQNIPNNVLNLISFFNSSSTSNNINISPFNILTKIKSVEDFNKNKEELNMNNFNDFPSPLNKNNNDKENIYDRIGEKYNQKLFEMKNDNIFEKSAFEDFDSIQKNDNIINSQPNQTNVIKLKLNPSFSNYNNNKLYKTDINFAKEDISYLKQKINGGNSGTKMYEFNNTMIRNSNPYMDSINQNQGYEFKSYYY